ncbi:hypothetical protein AMECASPLE_017360 [Ameca splendens]|uniref:Uncharacterized protein n=1 Tax=Ameca splendens TaxID=208324 RepID=A0ABV0ZN31_9TELE
MPLITAMPPAAGGMGGSDAGATKRPMPSDLFQVILGRPQLLHHGLEMTEEESRSHIRRCSRVCHAAMREEHTADAAQRSRMVSAKLQNSSTSSGGNSIS